MEHILEIEITKIHRGKNPRTYFDKTQLQELADSIRENGLMQPIVLEQQKEGYLLVMGERRLRAHQLLKKKTIKAIVREQTNHNGRERFLHAIIENDQRVDMNPIERGQAYRTLHTEYDMSVADIGKMVGKSSVQIYDVLLLTELDPEIQEFIKQGFWKDPRVARALLKIADRDTRIAVAERLHKHKVSLKGSLNALDRVLSTMVLTKTKAKTERGMPVFGFGDEPTKPMKWDALRQTGKLPAWDLVVYSASQTCESCSLRDIASELNCRECPAVCMLRMMMESAQ
jgi:ParB/RepB/Spo0J family partition protein